MKIPMKLVYQHMVIFFNVSRTSRHLHPLQVENCAGNSRLVLDEDDNGKFRLERVKALKYLFANQGDQRCFFQFEIIINILARPF